MCLYGIFKNQIIEIGFNKSNGLVIFWTCRLVAHFAQFWRLGDYSPPMNRQRILVRAKRCSKQIIDRAKYFNVFSFFDMSLFGHLVPNEVLWLIDLLLEIIWPAFWTLRRWSFAWLLGLTQLASFLRGRGPQMRPSFGVLTFAVLVFFPTVQSLFCGEGPQK